MAKTIKILGTIVDAWFDHDYFAEEIETGILTPSSRFVRELKAALEADADPVEIYINSVGGDVFAGAEMLAAIQDAGERVERVTVGGLAASMAANIALMAARPLAVHTNSLLYFHSAVSDVWGGPGAHADEAEMLDKINAPMIAKLKAVGVPAARVNEGFKDGRNMVLGADECAEFLGASIIGETAAAPEKPNAETIARIETPAANLERLADYTATLRRVAKCAAWVPTADVAETAGTADNAPAHDTPETAPETAQDAPADGDGANTSPEGETPAETRETGADGDSEAETAEIAEKTISEGNPAVIAALTKQLRSVQSNAAKKINGLKASLDQSRAETAAALKERDEVRAQRDEAQGRLADTQAQLAERTAQLEAERDAHAALVGAVLSPESDTEESESDTPHIDRMASFHSVDERLAYATAHRDEIAAERSRKH